MVDNCAAHPKDSADGLSQIQLIFLPPNVTAVIHPCDMGIIRNLKAMYRKNIISRIITEIDSGSSITASQFAKNIITLLDAMHMQVSWQNVKQLTVINCFAKAGFVSSPPDEEEEVEQPPNGMTLGEFQTFVDMDSSLECHGELTDEEICSSVIQSDCPQSDGEGDEGAATLAQNPKPIEALQAMHTVRVFLELNRTDLSMFYTVDVDVDLHV